MVICHPVARETRPDCSTAEHKGKHTQTLVLFPFRLHNIRQHAPFLIDLFVYLRSCEPKPSSMDGRAERNSPKQAELLLALLSRSEEPRKGNLKTQKMSSFRCIFYMICVRTRSHWSCVSLRAALMQMCSHFNSCKASDWTKESCRC